MKVKAVIDRLVDDKAILLVGEEELEMVVLLSEFPDHITPREGDWLEVQVIADTVNVLQIDENEMRKVRDRVNLKLEKLRNRSK